MRKLNALEHVDQELKGERASALRRAGERLEKALADLAGSAEGSTQHKELWRQAQRQLWYLVVQREALGLRRHEDVWTAYRIPPKLRPNY